MTNKQARTRYFKVFIPAMLGYLVSIFGVDVLIDMTVAGKKADISILTYGLALIPAIFVFTWVWSHARFILQIDEFARMLQIKSILYGLIALMGLTTAWGFLEMYAQVPAVPIFYVLPGFYLCYGVAAIFVSKKNMASCEML